MSNMKRSYKAGIRFSGNRKEKREQEKIANNRVKRHQQIVQSKIVNGDMVDKAYNILENDRKSGTFAAAALAKEVGDRSNIAQVSCNYVISAVNGALDREKKISYFLDLIKQEPRDALSWFIFNRNPYLESVLSKILKVKFDYSRNLIFSAGRQVSNNVQPFLPRIKQDEFVLALKTFIEEIKHSIVDTTNKNRKTIFLNKLLFLEKNQEFFSMTLFHWLEYQRNNPEHPPWKSLKYLSKHFSQMLGYKKRRELFSAIRGVLLLALSSYMDETVQEILRNINARDLIAKPYQKERKRLAPVDLIMGRKYVITRPGNGKELTKLAIKDGKFTLGIKDPDKSRSKIIPAELMISKRMRRMLKKGAEISSLSIRSGSAPSYKIIVSIHLDGSIESFQSTRFLDKYPVVSNQRVKTIGMDINKVGPHILVFSEAIQLPDILKKLCKRYNHLGTVISQLSKAVSRAEDSDHRKKLKIEGERTRVYKRRKNILKEIKEQCRMLSTAVLVQTGVSTFNIEKLELSARGKRGSLAKAILNMPDELTIFEQAIILASIHTGTKIELKQINPRGSSSVHHKCLGKLRRGPGKWDIAPCSKCGIEVNTHLNAAKFIRDGGLIRPLSA